MSDAELSLSYELLELISLRVGDEGLKKFINDFDVKLDVFDIFHIFSE